MCWCVSWLQLFFLGHDSSYFCLGWLRATRLVPRAGEGGSWLCPPGILLFSEFGETAAGPWASRSLSSLENTDVVLEPCTPPVLLPLDDWEVMLGVGYSVLETKPSVCMPQCGDSVSGCLSSRRWRLEGRATGNCNLLIFQTGCPGLREGLRQAQVTQQSRALSVKV